MIDDKARAKAVKALEKASRRAGLPDLRAARGGARAAARRDHRAARRRGAEARREASADERRLVAAVKLAITGGTGFVGSHSIDAALGAGHQVAALTRRPQPPRDG